MTVTADQAAAVADRPLSYREQQALRVPVTAATLRALADLIETPGVPTPAYLLDDVNGWYVGSKAEAGDLMIAASRAGWEVLKDYRPAEQGGGLTRIRIRNDAEGPWINGLVSTAQVCERVQTGTTTVEHPAEPAREATAAWSEEVPTFEYRCEPLLAGREVATGPDADLPHF